MSKCEITEKGILRKYGTDGEKIALGRTQADVLYLYKKVYIEFRRCVCLLFMLREYNSGFNTMFESVGKQGRLLGALTKVLRTHKLEKEELLYLHRNLSSSEKRIENIKRIVGENFKETEVYPYYKYLISNGISIFDDALVDSYVDIREVVNQFKAGAEKYNQEHREEYEAHLVVMNQLIENRETAISIRKEMAKIEKETQKAIKKKMAAEQKEMEANARKYRRRDEALGIAGNAYYYR